MTNGSSTNRKRSASLAHMDVSDDDKSLFADTDDSADAPDAAIRTTELMLVRPTSDDPSTGTTLTL